MNTRSPYPDVEVPEISLPRFILDRVDERRTAVPLTAPADHGSASPLMGPATAGTITALMGPANTDTWLPAAATDGSTLMVATGSGSCSKCVTWSTCEPARWYEDPHAYAAELMSIP